MSKYLSTLGYISSSGLIAWYCKQNDLISLHVCKCWSVSSLFCPCCKQCLLWFYSNDITVYVWFVFLNNWNLMSEMDEHIVSRKWDRAVVDGNSENFCYLKVYGYTTMFFCNFFKGGNFLWLSSLKEMGLFFPRVDIQKDGKMNWKSCSPWKCTYFPNSRLN